MSKFTPTSKSNPCPSCDDTSGNCRHQAEGEIILCMSAGSGRKGDLVGGGYKIIDFSQDGLWAILKPDNTQQWSEERRREWADEQKRRRERLQQEQQQKLAQLLPTADRNKQYRRIVATLGLNQKHRLSELSEHRGLTSDEIEFAIAQGWLCSWKPGVKVDASSRLAGVAAGQLVGVTGLGIAAVNSDGQITGFQIASDNRAKFGKYIWLSSASKGGNSPHLPSGELPVFVWRHPETKEVTETWLIEGGLKSLITALKLWFRCGRKDIQIIGAAGGNWHGSINTVKEALGQTSKVVLCPDAGSLANDHISGNYRKTIDALSSQGCSVNVAWWGQFSKVDGDIDEVSSPLAFDEITPREFFGLKDKANWIKSRNFTPDIILNQREFQFPDNIPDTGVVVGVKSGLGTGKTEALIQLIKSSFSRAFLISYRNNLLAQTNARAGARGLNILHLREDDGIDLVADDNSNLSMCLDSIKHIDGYFSGADIYLDEAVSILLHGASGGTLGDEQGKALAILNKGLRECDRVILLDGNLADFHVDFIAEISGKKPIKIENQAKIPPHKIKFIVGVNEESEIKKRDKSPLIKAMLADGIVPWVTSDSRNLTNILDEIFKQAGKTGYVINKDTTGEAWAKEFLANPNDFILKYKPDYFIGSPSIESGISVTLKSYFTDKFTFFTGVQNTNSQHQMLFRLRDDEINHYVFCPEFSTLREKNSPRTYSTKAFESMLNERINQSALLACGSNTKQIMSVVEAAFARNDDDWWGLSVKLGAINNYEKDNLRSCLIHALKEAGHNIEVLEWEIDGVFKDKEKSAKEVVQHRYALEIYNAIAFENIELAKAAKKSNPNKDTQRRIEKTILLDRLPDISKSSAWNVDYVKKVCVKDADFISKQQRFYMLNNFEISKKRSEVNWYYLATNQNFFMGQAGKDGHLKVWALQQLNILQFLSGEYHKESPEVIELIEKIRNDKSIARALNIKLPKTTSDKRENIAFISQLLDSIGLSFAKPSQVLINGVKTRVYTLDREKLNLANRIDTLAAIERKFDGYLTSEAVSKVKWEDHTLEPPAAPQPQPETEVQITDDSINEWLSAENIQYLNECLALCEEREDLELLRRAAPPEALREASRHLPRDQKEQIRKWVLMTS